MKDKKIDVNLLPPLLRISQTAEILSVSPWTLRLWDKNGKLKAVRVGTRKDRRYKRDDIVEILEKGL